MKNEVHQYDSEGKYVKTFPSKSDAERELNLYRGAVTDYMRSGRKAKILFSLSKNDFYPDFGQKQTAESEVEPVNTPISMLSEEQLREKHDMFFQLKLFIGTIPEGKFIDEGTMLRQLGLIGKPRYKDAVSRPELKDYKGKVDGTVYYGHAVSIRKLKNEGVLQ